MVVTKKICIMILFIILLCNGKEQTTNFSKGENNVKELGLIFGTINNKYWINSNNHLFFYVDFSHHTLYGTSDFKFGTGFNIGLRSLLPYIEFSPLVKYERIVFSNHIGIQTGIITSVNGAGFVPLFYDTIQIEMKLVKYKKLIVQSIFQFRQEIITLSKSSYSIGIKIGI